MIRAIYAVLGTLVLLTALVVGLMSAHTFEDGSGGLWQSQTGEYAVTWCLPWGDCQIQ